MRPNHKDIKRWIRNMGVTVYADLTPTTKQQLFEEVKNKAVKCADRTQLCAAIYPFILHLAREYAGKEYNILQWQRAADSFKADLYGFRQALSPYVSAIPLAAFHPRCPSGCPSDLESLRNDILDAAIETAVDVARIETAQNCVNLSAVMARFVEDL